MPHGVIGSKITANNLFDCSDLKNFVSSIIQILPYRGFSMSRFYLCELDGIRFLTKLCFYRKSYPEIYNRASKKSVPHIDAEIMILTILKEKITDQNISPCILEIVYSAVCTDIQKMTMNEITCDQLMLDYKDSASDDVDKLMCTYADLVRNGLAHDKCAFLVLDKCDMTLDEYLKRSLNMPITISVIKSLLFQIVYTMYAIHKLYPGFHHYDLHTENIMLKFDQNYKFVASNPRFLVFNIDGVKYSVPYFGIIPKIIDFGFSVLPEENVISNIIEDKYQMYYRSHNDLLFLYYHIYNTISHPAIDKILYSLEPNRSYIQFHTESIRKIEEKIPSYETMAKNPIWSEYTKFTPNKNQIYNEFMEPQHKI